MKKIVTLIALVFVSVAFAQDMKPTFEKEGDLTKATYYHANGEIAQLGYFLDGKLHGEWKMYNETGKKIAMGQYTTGKKTGKWFFWKGEVLQEVDYNDNRVANVVQWNTSEPIVINK